MKRDWEEMLDQLEEKDLAEYLPETLPEVDEVTKKRIVKQTLGKIKKERKRFSQKQIVAAIICLVAVLGVVGREPIQAAFERLFYYLPGAGMYVDEEENIYYEAEIINLAELTREEYENDSPDKYDKLEEMYALTMEYDGKEHDMAAPSKGVTSEDENDTYMITRYRRDYQRYVKNVEQTYTVHIAGLENTLSFRLIANTGKEQRQPDAKRYYNHSQSGCGRAGHLFGILCAH